MATMGSMTFFRRQAPSSARAEYRWGDGGRLAVGAAVAATALLPLLRPRGPANTGPVDALIVLALLAALLWFGSSRRQLGFPYALPLGLFLVGGALGALSGPIPQTGVLALAQDVTLLLWFWAVVNIGSSPERLQAILLAWAYAAIG